MLKKDLLREGWLAISCKNTSPAQSIMRIFSPYFLLFHVVNSPYAHKGGAV